MTTSLNINSFLQASTSAGGQSPLFYSALYKNQTGDPATNGYVQNISYLVQQQQNAINNARLNSAFPGAAPPVSAKPSGSSPLYGSFVSLGNVPVDLVATAATNLQTQQKDNILSSETSAAVKALRDVTPAEGLNADFFAANPANLPANFAQSGVSSIGDLLLNASGLSVNGSIGEALQAQAGEQGSSTGPAASGSVLAGVLSPSSNLSPSDALQVTDFVDTSLDAFPTSAPAQPDNQAGSQASDNADGSNTSNDFAAGGSGNASPTQNSGSNSSPAAGSGSPSGAGAYSAIANASASTIRGSGVNTTA